MSNQQPPTKLYGFSPYKQRLFVGIIGLGLPVVLWVFSCLGKVFFEGPGIESSISAYYYTGMRNVFVGSLSAIGLLMLSYQGYKKKKKERISDSRAGNFAGICVIVVALAPTTPPVNPTSLASLIGWIHLVFAGAFFAMLAYFSLCLFRRTDKTDKEELDHGKKRRNLYYTICGWFIVACIFLAFLVTLLPDDSPVIKHKPLFYLETIALVAFSVSWLTKSESPYLFFLSPDPQKTKGRECVVKPDE